MNMELRNIPLKRISTDARMILMKGHPIESIPEKISSDIGPACVKKELIAPFSAGL